MNWQRIIDDLWLRLVRSGIYNTVVVMGFVSPAVIIIAAVLCSGCLSGDKSPAPYTELTQKYQLPSELKDCKIYGLALIMNDFPPNTYLKFYQTPVE